MQRLIIQDRALRIAPSTASVKGKITMLVGHAERAWRGDNERQTAKKLV